ncbi:MAG: hypothetical protein J6X60_02675 [Ruminiclostridium sp.]|nr:hypothetical protein [Ruminiclostridium sp.]
MRNHIIITAVFLIVSILSGCNEHPSHASSGDNASSVTPEASASGTDAKYPTADELNAYYSIRNEQNRRISDGLYYHAEDNVNFALLRCEDEVYSFRSDPDKPSGWKRMYYDSDLPLENGEFAMMTADVTFESGGIDGRNNVPKVRRLINFEKTDLQHVLEYCGYDTSSETVSTVNGKPCLILHFRGSHPVVKPDGGRTYDHYNCYFVIGNDGLIGRYDYDKYTLEYVKKLINGEKLIEDDYEARIMKNERICVFRVGEKYYSFRTSIFLNKYPTELYNDKFENKLPDGYELKDGECAVMNADLKLLSGGDLVNAPMIISVLKFEPCDYDLFIRKLAISPIRDYASKGEGDLDDAMFDRNSSGTWLLFFTDGKYRLYLENIKSGRKNIGSFETFEKAKTVVDGKGE